MSRLVCPCTSVTCRGRTPSDSARAASTAAVAAESICPAENGPGITRSSLPVRVTLQLLDFDAKRMHYFEQLFHAEEGWLSATSENMVLNVDMTAKKVAPFPDYIAARLAQLVSEAEAGYEHWLTVDVTRAFEAYVDDLSNWYIRRSRRRFWEGDETAFRTLWFGLVQGLRVIAPVMPFLADHLWRSVVAAACEDAPASVFLAGWPEAGEPDWIKRQPTRDRVVALDTPSQMCSARWLTQYIAPRAVCRTLPAPA